MFFMNKSDRAKFIRELWQARGGNKVGVIGLIQASESEVKEEINPVVSERGTNDEIIDEIRQEIVGIVAPLPFDSVHVSIHEKDFILSPSERRQLARERALTKQPQTQTA